MKKYIVTILFAGMAMCAVAQSVAEAEAAKRREVGSSLYSTATYSYISFSTYSSIVNGQVSKETLDAEGVSASVEAGAKSMNSDVRKLSESLNSIAFTDVLSLLNHLGTFRYRLVSVTPVGDSKFVRKTYILMRED